LKNVEDEDNTQLLEQLDKDLEQLNKEKSLTQKEFDDSVIDLDVLDSIKVLFGEKGIRSSILARLVGLFNERLAYYLDRLDAPCIIKFDSDFDNVMESLGGNEISYGTLSGGEAFRVNTAISFTFRDVLRIQNQIHIKLSFFDEYFDGVLDTKGLNILGEIIKERCDEMGESSYIISHRKDFEIEDSNKILVVKENNVSRIEEYERSKKM